MLARELEVIERNLQVLALVKKRGPIGMVQISKELDLPVHRVRYSLRLLQEDGLVEPTNAGAVATTKVDGFNREMRLILKRFGGYVRD
jgi:predicted transcriptional regulator